MEKVNRIDHDKRSRLENNKQGFKNTVRLVARETDVCTVAHNILGTIIEDFDPLHTKMCVSSRKLNIKRQITVSFTDDFRILGPQDGTCWHLEF